MEERHQEYVQEIRLQVLKEETECRKPAHASEKYDFFGGKLDQKKKLTRSAMELLRPATMEENCRSGAGCLKAFAGKIGVPLSAAFDFYMDHRELEKTTAARLVFGSGKKN